MAENKDVKGVDEILKGLSTLLQDQKLSRWSYRANIYLSAAEKYHDDRLVEPLIKILNLRESPFKYTHDNVIKLLVKYDDLRVPKLILSELAIENPYTTGDVTIVAMTELTRLLGNKTGDFLIANYKKTNNIDLKCHILHILAQLSYDNDVYAYPRKGSWACEAVVAKKYAAEMREKAFKVLCNTLKSPEAKIRKNAAWALGSWGIGMHKRIDVMKDIYKWVNFDKRALAPLNNFLSLNPKMILEMADSYCFAEYLSNFGDKETVDLCFEQLKKNPKSFDLPMIVASLQPKGSFAFFANQFDQACRQFPKKGKIDGLRKYLDPIAKYEDQGGKFSDSRLKQVTELPIQKAIINTLDKMKYRPGAASIADLTVKLIKDGKGNPKLGKTAKQRWDEFNLLLYSYTRTVEKLDPDIARQLAQKVLISNVPPDKKAWAYRVYMEKKHPWIDYAY